MEREPFVNFEPWVPKLNLLMFNEDQSHTFLFILICGVFNIVVHKLRNLMLLIS